jgi:hypothetical protein
MCRWGCVRRRRKRCARRLRLRGAEPSPWRSLYRRRGRRWLRAHRCGAGSSVQPRARRPGDIARIYRACRVGNRRSARRDRRRSGPVLDRGAVDLCVRTARVPGRGRPRRRVACRPARRDRRCGRRRSGPLRGEWQRARPALGAGGDHVRSDLVVTRRGRLDARDPLGSRPERRRASGVALRHDGPFQRRAGPWRPGPKGGAGLVGGRKRILRAVEPIHPHRAHPPDRRAGGVEPIWSARLPSGSPAAGGVRRCKAAGQPRLQRKYRAAPRPEQASEEIAHSATRSR